MAIGDLARFCLIEETGENVRQNYLTFCLKAEPLRIFNENLRVRGDGSIRTTNGKCFLKYNQKDSKINLHQNCPFNIRCDYLKETSIRFKNYKDLMRLKKINEELKEVLTYVEINQEICRNAKKCDGIEISLSLKKKFFDDFCEARRLAKIEYDNIKRCYKK